MSVFGRADVQQLGRSSAKRARLSEREAEEIPRDISYRHLRSRGVCDKDLKDRISDTGDGDEVSSGVAQLHKCRYMAVRKELLLLWIARSVFE